MVESAYVKFASNVATIDLISLSNESMPALTYYPHNATLTFKSNNEKIALIRDVNVYDVMCIAPGITSIEASLKVGNNGTASDKLELHVEADSADYVLSELAGAEGHQQNSRYTLTGAGILKTRSVKDVPGVTVNFGSASIVNTTIVRDEKMADGSQQFVATTIAFNDGWRDCQFDEKGIPTQGTFYHIVPQASGDFTFWGYPAGNNRVVLLQVAKGGTRTRVADATIEAGNDKKLVSKTVSLSPEYEYYLFGINASPNCPTEEGDVKPNDSDNSHWCTFQLQSFKYVTKFYLTNESAIVSGDPSKKGSAENVATLEGYNASHEYTIEKLYTLGTIAGYDVELSSTGVLSFKNITYSTENGDEQGGAAVVRISNPADGEVEFVLTVPYGLHQWNFYNGQVDANNPQPVQDPAVDNVTYDNLRKDAYTYYNEDGVLVTEENSLRKSWGINYEVREWTNRVLTECKDPVLGVLSPVDGTNAAYIPNTAGLVFRAGSLGFGTRIDEWTVPTVDGSGTETLNNASFNARYSYNERLMMPVANVSGVAYVKFGSYRVEASLVIPQVKKNRYVRIFWKQHSGSGGSSGATFSAKNLADLDGKEITEKFQVSGVGYNTNSPYYHGCVIFRATGDEDYNDAILSIKDGGYNYIVRVDITDDYETDLRMYSRATKKIMEDYVRDNGHLSHKQGTTASFQTDGSQNWSEAARYANYKVVATDGITEDEDFTIADHKWTSEGGGNYNDCIVTAIKGNGSFLLQQNMYYGDYVLNRMEQWVAIGEYTVKDYPYTWDFTAYNMDAPADEADKAVTKMAATVGSQTTGSWDASYRMQRWVNVDAQTVKKWNGSEWVGHPLSNWGSGMFEKPMFANGGELTVNHEPIRETQGLSISLGSDGRSSQFTIRDRVNRQITLNGKFMKIDNAGTSATPTVMIPEVDAGMYVFVKASVAPSEVSGATEVDQYEGHVNKFDKKDGVYVYKVSEKGDVVLSFANASEVEKIGVTNEFKQIVNTAGKTTESRARAIDYSQTQHFVNSTLHAYTAVDYVDGENKQTGTLTLKELKVSPAETGLVLFTENTSGNVSNPLFVPACNNLEDNTDGNLMKPNVTESSLPGSTDEVYRYVLTNRFRLTEGEDKNWREGDYGFYKVNEAGTLKANMAYLELSADNVGYARQIVLFENPDYGTSGIETLEGDVWSAEGGARSLEREEPVAFYTLGGTRLNGVPTEKGIYIVRSDGKQQGRKVIVK